MNPRSILIPAAILLLLFIGVIGAYQSAKYRTGTIVLPGGITYLGPSTTPTPPPPVFNPDQIPVPDDAAWTEYSGKLFPYSFSYPAFLSLGVFPNDPFDGVTIFWNDTKPAENIFLRVENLENIAGQSGFIKKPKLEYVQNWWNQYAWKGVKSIVAFTNAQGLTGYRATYIDAAGATPYDQVFFEVPGKPELVIWVSGRLFTPSVFDRLIDSIAWGKPTPTP